MADLKKAKEALEKKGYKVELFATGSEAADYLEKEIDRTTVALGGMKTAEDLQLFERLEKHNEVIWHWRQDAKQALERAKTAEVYISSVNALSEDGTMVNIDATGNRVAAGFFGHKKVYFVIGSNKLTEEGMENAITRARNVAAPQRAKVMGRKTPCAKNADRCYDCSSPERICRGMSVMMYPIGSCETEILLIEEELGL